MRGIHSLLEKSLEEWSISYECIPCKCAVDHGEGGLEERERGGGGEGRWNTARSFELTVRGSGGGKFGTPMRR